jgi:hypothetical protein
MTEQRRKDALKYIEGQLEYGYIDLCMNDQDELEIIKEAINLLKAIDKFNSIGCTSFRLTPEETRNLLETVEPKTTIDDWKRLGYTDEEAEELVEYSKIYQ